MDTASLRIKFTPLMQEVKTDDSKCCLEIVPEVSCLKNFDKIEWKNERDFYEYVIPMNYKIILKKRGQEKVQSDNLNQTYHSCVDLLRPSITSCSMGSGDVNRIVSDFILSRITADTECNVSLSPCNEHYCAKDKAEETSSSQASEKENQVTTYDSQNDESLVDESTTLLQNKSRPVTENISSQSEYFEEVIDVVKRCVEKGTRTSQETVPPSCIEENNTSSETIDHLINSRSPTDTLGKLSLTPICSVNTDDSALTPPNENSFNSIIPHNYHSETAFRGQLSPLPAKVYNIFATSIQFENLKHNVFLPPIRRLTPQERIEQFVKCMEKEILPLKTMLNDILRKYTSLNINCSVCKNTVQSKKYHSNTHKKKTLRRITETRTEVGPNRVNYYITFED